MKRKTESVFKLSGDLRLTYDHRVKRTGNRKEMMNGTIVIELVCPSSQLLHGDIGAHGECLEYMATCIFYIIATGDDLHSVAGGDQYPFVDAWI
jgi:hypothetical protein